MTGVTDDDFRAAEVAWAAADEADRLIWLAKFFETGKLGQLRSGLSAAQLLTMPWLTLPDALREALALDFRWIRRLVKKAVMRAKADAL